MSQFESGLIFKRLNPKEMERTLDSFLKPVLSYRRTAAEPAKKLAGFNLEAQNFAIYWVDVINSFDTELAFQFADHFSPAYLCLKGDLKHMREWVIHALESYDHNGLIPAIKIFHEVEEFAELLFSRVSAVSFEENRKVLEIFIRGLSGRQLDLQRVQGESSFSDTQSIFLPEYINHFANPEDNFLYYKAMLVHHWAANRFGTFEYDLAQWSQQFSHPSQALQLLNSFENIRLDYWISKELAGLHRQMQRFRQEIIQLSQQGGWRAIQQLLQNEASVKASLELVESYYSRVEPINPKYSGHFDVEQVNRVKLQRISAEKNLFQSFLGEILTEQNFSFPPIGQTPFSRETWSSESSGAENGIKIELFLNGQLIQPPEQIQPLIESIVIDCGTLPLDYLYPNVPVINPLNSEDNNAHEDDCSETNPQKSYFYYDEWDIARRNYKKKWCRVQELVIEPKYDDFVEKTLEKHLGLVKSLRHTFEMLRAEPKMLKRQSYGDDIDIDAVVEGYSDLVAGFEMPQHLFTQKDRAERNIAVTFLIDMSGSTQGWINRIEREALVLLCESLEILGDRYAIFGFSGVGRNACEIYPIKDFDEYYGTTVKARISGVGAKDYTRLGAAIRHMNQKLFQIEARTKLMITLSDGKPEDSDSLYRGEYGIEDTRQALVESKQKGIHTFCITIDDNAQDYLPHMYGSSNYALVKEVDQLPLKVSEIYRKLTT